MNMMSDALKSLRDSAGHESTAHDQNDMEILQVSSDVTLGDATQLPRTSDDENDARMFSSPVDHDAAGATLQSGSAQDNAMTLTPKPFVGDIVDFEIPPPSQTHEPIESESQQLIEDSFPATETDASVANDIDLDDTTWYEAEPVSDPNATDHVPDEAIEAKDMDSSPVTTADVISNVVQRVQEIAADHRADVVVAATESADVVAADEAVSVIQPAFVDEQEAEQAAASSCSSSDEETPSNLESLSTLDAFSTSADAKIEGSFDPQEARNADHESDHSLTEMDINPDAVLPDVPQATAASQNTFSEPPVSNRTPFEARIEANLRQPLIREQYDQLAAGLLETATENGIALIASVDAKPLVAVIGHLAWCIADDRSKPGKVLLVDADVHGRSLSKYLNANETEGLLEACGLDNAWPKFLRPTSNDRVTFLPAGGLTTRPVLRSETISEILNANKETDTTVLIFGGADGNASTRVCHACENTFLLVTLGLTNREKAIQTVGTVQSSGGKLRGCIMTDVPRVA